MRKPALNKIAALAAAVCMIFTSIPAWAATQTDPSMIDYDQSISEKRENYIELVGKAALSYSTDFIDVSALKLRANSDDISDFQSAVQANYPELFYWRSTSYYSSGSYVTKIRPVYSYDKDTAMSMLAEFYNEADKYLALVNDSMSNLEIAIVLHDAIVNDVAYEYPDVADKETYSLLIEKVGYCDLYSKVYAYLLSQCGIRSEIVFSDAMNHEWLKAELIPGRYFNIDITWDDPTPNVNGRVTHTYFGLSDTALQSDNSHYDYSTIYPDDKYFDNSGIKDLDTAIVELNGDLYAIYSNSSNWTRQLVKLNIVLGQNSGKIERNTVSNLNNMVWSAGSQGYWTGVYTGFFKHGSKLYYNTPDSICWFDPATSESGVLVKPSKPSGKSIYGCYTDNGTVYAVYKSSPNDSGTPTYSAVYDLGDEPYVPPVHEHSYSGATWKWSDDMSSATASFKCISCTDTQTVNAKVVSSYNSSGDLIYTATAQFNGKTYTDVKTVSLYTLTISEALEIVGSDRPAVNGKYYSGTKVTVKARDEFSISRLIVVNISEYKQNSDGTLTVTVSGNSEIRAEYKVSTTFIEGFSVTLGSQIGLNVYFKPEYDIVDDGYITFSGKSGEIRIAISDITPDENGRYKATFYMSAKDIDEKVNISFGNGSGNNVEFSLLNGKPFVESIAYSPTDYLNILSKSSDKKLAALADSVKVYGNNAKAFFDGITPDKMVTGLTASDINSFAPSVTAGKSTKYYGQSLLLRSNTALRLYFKGDISGCKVTDSKGRNVSYVTGTASGMNYVEIPDITADNLESKFTVALADGGKVTLSPMTYVYETLLHYEKDSSNAQLCSTVRALYNYNKAVQNYLS
ncbi:transglutaminase domain-containing protein [Ruminococcus albus]|uniref:Transglutaminase-like superfamily protein n=1 Tax=Ruminococcus albus TaxID=1264 RepID=A0A1H7MCJ1_RUMAL|nr:hypothetical protein [Ruminococcus albus]SEL09050.1 hypothetical protein SAMN05216469_11184 [Ruminococcus albus]